MIREHSTLNGPLKTIESFSDERGEVRRALGEAGRQEAGMVEGATVEQWRKAQLAMLGVRSSPNPTCGEVLQRTGEATGQQFLTVEHDDTGRPIKRFYGDPNQTWAAFMATPRRLVGIDKQPQPLPAHFEYDRETGQVANFTDGRGHRFTPK